MTGSKQDNPYLSNYGRAKSFKQEHWQARSDRLLAE